MAELCGPFGDDLHHHHGGGDVVVGSGKSEAVLLRPGVGPAHNPHYDYESSSPLFLTCTTNLVGPPKRTPYHVQKVTRTANI